MECVNDDTLKTMRSNSLIAEGHGQGRFGVVKFVVDFVVACLNLQTKVCGGEKNSVCFSPPTTMVQ